jgi:drug/metabolite transporter (DMT)-like permease
MVAAALGFGTAVCWGAADFLGGLRTRRLTLAAVLLFSQLTGLAAVALVVAAGGKGAPSLGEVAPAIAAGVCQLVAIAALYRALAIGTMSVISPITASGAAAIPVVVGVATGDKLAALQVAGMVAALVGVALACRTPDSARGGDLSREALLLSGVAALGFGGFFVGMDAAGQDADPFWSLLVARLSAGAVLATALAVLRPRIGARPPEIPTLALIGLLDVAANACFTLGTEAGLLSVVAVLASLYPVTTVILARAVLEERLVAIQAAGVALALTGVVLIAAG